MSATLTNIKRGTVTDHLVDEWKAVFAKPDVRTGKSGGYMHTYNVEREEPIELLGLCLLGGIDCLFLGDPGTGKTWMLELLLMLIDGVDEDDFFSTLVFKETPADDVLGPRDLPSLKQGVIKRITDGYLPSSVLAYIDEVFKASPTLLNALLDLYANRVLKVGKDRIDAKQLLMIVSSSNELPDREDLNAFRDRYGLTYFVQPVRTPEGRVRVMEIQDEIQAGGNVMDLTNAPSLALDNITKMRAEVARIVIPRPIMETMNEAEEKWESAGHGPSQRRVGQMLKALKARAWTQGRGEVLRSDMTVCQHMAWNHPDHFESARNIVLEFASTSAREARRIREALEPFQTKLEELRAQVNNASPVDKQQVVDDQMVEAFGVMKDIRRLRREADNGIETAQRQGDDTSELESVVKEMDRSNDYINKVWVGKDDD